MSTLSISPAIDMSRVRKARSRSAVRLTRRGRVVAVLAFLAVAFAVMTTMSGWATASLSGGTPEPVRVVTVQPGDTLYGIAGDVAKDGPVLVKGVDTIDISAISTDIIALGHTEYAERRELLNDIALLFRKGERPPHRRTPMYKMIRAARGVFWRVQQ